MVNEIASLYFVKFNLVCKSMKFKNCFHKIVDVLHITTRKAQKKWKNCKKHKAVDQITFFNNVDHRLNALQVLTDSYAS